MVSQAWHPTLNTVKQTTVMNAIKVAIVEENHYVREGLTQLINGTQGFNCVGAFSNATDILHVISRTKPQVILMDINLAGKMDGIAATMLIKEHFPHIAVIIQTVSEDNALVFQTIKAGASGYLLKNTPPAKLLEAIQDVMTGGSPLSPTIAFKALQMFREADIGTPYDTPSVSKLTERQREIVDNILKGKSYKTIAEELFISVETVKFHVKNVYEILGIHSKYELMTKFKQR
jgi:DNA-binding NarL/FixJ family response regulator